MQLKLTDKLVRELETPAKGNKIHYDSEVAGFGVRVTASGAKAFVLNYRFEGRERRHTIGKYGSTEWGVARARKRAGELRRDIAIGIDPQGERAAARSAPTISDLCDRYIEEWLPRKRPSSQRDDIGMIGQIIRPRLGKVKVEKIRHADIDKLHRGLIGTPTRANRVIALLSKMFSLSIKWDWRSDNPCKGIERNQEAKRRRYLKPDELERLTTALNELKDQQAANVVRLCLLTGCRRGEAFNARWDQFDFDSGQWTKPGSTTKQKTDHEAPLSDAAIQLLQGIRAENGDESDYVFTTPDGEPLTHIREQWDAIRKTANLPDVRLHDLRHTYASVLVSAGASLPLIGALLGHSTPTTTARYAHLLDDPMRKATNIVGDIVSGKPSAEVVTLREDGAA